MWKGKKDQKGELGEIERKLWKDRKCKTKVSKCDFSLVHKSKRLTLKSEQLKEKNDFKLINSISDSKLNLDEKHSPE